MKIIIAGDGKVGLALTRLLSEEGHDLVTIDSNREVLERNTQLYDVMAVAGNCATMATLREANVEQADVLIAATSADEINLLCCLTARKLNPSLHTIARVRSPEYIEQLYLMREDFGLSMIINPEREAAKEIFRLLKIPGFLKRETFAKGRVEIVELRVMERSLLENVILNHLPHVLNGCKVLVCAVIRDGKAFIPTGDTMLRRGDHIYVKIIEQRADRCLMLANMLPRASIIEADGSSQSVLDNEGVGETDALVTLTGLDEQNVIMSLYGSAEGVPHVITKVNRMESTGMLENLSVGSVVSPKELCCAHIVQYVRAMQNQTGAAVTLHRIADGRAEALEFVVNKNSRYVGEPLKRLRLKPNILISCITHKGRTILPDGNSAFEMGDTVIVVTSRETPILQFNDIFA